MNNNQTVKMTCLLFLAACGIIAFYSCLESNNEAQFFNDISFKIPQTK